MSEIFDIYYKKYRYGFRIGSYSGFVRGFCAAPIAPYLVEESELALATLERLRRTRAIMFDAIQLGLDDLFYMWRRTLSLTLFVFYECTAKNL